jgi:hypothetical protein
MRALAAAALLTALSLMGGCSKCDVPTYGWAQLVAPAACTGAAPGR